MKFRKIIKRDVPLYAQLTGCCDPEYHGIVIKFKKSSSHCIGAIVVASHHESYPVGYTGGSWTNPLFCTNEWTMLPDFVEQN